MRAAPRVVQRHIIACVTSAWNWIAKPVPARNAWIRKMSPSASSSRAARQVEALAVPLIHVGRPVADRAARRRRLDRIVADLGLAFRMGDDALAEMPRQHLRAEADAEKRLVLAQRHADEVDLGLDEIVGIVGALRAAEDHRAGMLRHRGGQRIAEARAADVEIVAAVPERVTDASGRRLLLVQDDQNLFGHRHAVRLEAADSTPNGLTGNFKANAAGWLRSTRTFGASRPALGAPPAPALVGLDRPEHQRRAAAGAAAKLTTLLPKPGMTTRLPAMKPS